MTAGGELIACIDEYGMETGRVEVRRRVHRSGLRHRTVHVWIRDIEGRLLLQKRAPGKLIHPNRWDISTAGHIPAGQTIIEAALREVSEELGLSVTGRELRPLGEMWQEYHSGDGTVHDRELVHPFICERPFSLEDLTLQESEISAVTFVTPSRLREMVKNNDKHLVPHPEEYALLFDALYGNPAFASSTAPA